MVSPLSGIPFFSSLLRPHHLRHFRADAVPARASLPALGPDAAPIAGRAPARKGSRRCGGSRISSTATRAGGGSPARRPGGRVLAGALRARGSVMPAMEIVPFSASLLSARRSVFLSVALLTRDGVFVLVGMRSWAGGIVAVLRPRAAPASDPASAASGSVCSIQCPRTRRSSATSRVSIASPSDLSAWASSISDRCPSCARRMRGCGVVSMSDPISSSSCSFSPGRRPVTAISISPSGFPRRAG